MARPRPASVQRRRIDSDPTATAPTIEAAVAAFGRSGALDQAALRRGLAQVRAFVTAQGMHASTARDLVAIAALAQTDDAAKRFDFEIDHAIHELLGRCASCRRQ
jgi:hypothetical protein